jgi:toxin ParE1/3/4
VKVVFALSAVVDLEEIGDGIARDDPARARTFVAELTKACRSIGRAPHSFPLADRSRAPILRRRIYRNYLIFYEVGPKEAEILHVLHGARDYSRVVFANDDAG